MGSTMQARSPVRKSWFESDSNYGSNSFQVIVLSVSAYADRSFNSVIEVLASEI